MKFRNLFILAFLFMLASPSETFAQTTKEEAQIKETTKTITTKVKGITCSNDLKTISTNVTKLKGVTSCKADKAGPTTRFKIVYAPTLITEQEIYKTIEATGSCENPNEKPYKVKQ